VQTIPDPSAPDAFITRPLSACLDFVRFGAALVVLVCHSAQAKLYTGYFPKIPMAQHYAVVVFFVLSGLVITTSARRRQGKLRNYALARAARIVPAAIIAILFSSAAYLLTKAIGAPLLHYDQWGDLSLRAFITPLLFLSESPWGSGPLWNPPYWSLCYEVWYYALFGAGVFLRGWKRIVWLAVFAVLAGPKVLLMLPIWLIGVGLELNPLARRTGWAMGLVWLAAGLALAWYQTTQVFKLLPMVKSFARAFDFKPGFSVFALSDTLLGLGVAAIFIGLRPLVTRWPRPWLASEWLARELAGFSFTLYLFHWPLLSLIKTFHLTAGESLPGFIALITGMTATCYAFSFITERQRETVRRWVKYSVLRIGEARANRG